MNYRGRSPLVLGIALAALLTMDTTDDELRRRREREAREPRPVPIPDPDAEHARHLARDPLGMAIVDARARMPISEREYDEQRARIQGEIDGMLPGHPPEVQAMIDAEERAHRDRIIARNARPLPPARREDRRPVHTASRPWGQSQDAAQANVSAAQAKRDRKAAKRLKEQGR